MVVDQQLEVTTYGAPCIDREDETKVDTVDFSDAAITEVAGSSSTALSMMAEASTPKQVTKKYKGKDVYMAKSGIMMERDAWWVLPTTALSYPNPEDYALGVQYGEAKPQGRLFTGKNRKARRTSLSKNK